MRLHASAVALDGRGVLITGAAGSGKSSLALTLMAYGAVLISDDQTELSRVGDTIWARAPETISGLIEARGAGGGVFRVDQIELQRAAAAVDHLKGDDRV